MFDNFKYNLLHNWSLMRSLRFVLGVIAISQAFTTYEILIGLVGILLLGQAVFNIACCGTHGCSRRPNALNKTTHNEEIK